jgi:TRAP-type uncharacterized transport system fused permease subunit
VTVYAGVEFTNPGIFRAIDPTRLDIVFGTILVVLLLEATRRVAGASLAIIALIFMVYAFVGPWVPGLLGEPGFEYWQVVSSMYIRLEGIFGTALGASATYVYVFILFRAFMIRMGGGDFSSTSPRHPDARAAPQARSRSSPARCSRRSPAPDPPMPQRSAL